MPSPFESAVFLLIDRNCITYKESSGHLPGLSGSGLCRKMALAVWEVLVGDSVLSSGTRVSCVRASYRLYHRVEPI